MPPFKLKLYCKTLSFVVFILCSFSVASQIHSYCGADILSKSESQEQRKKQIAFEKKYRNYALSGLSNHRDIKYTLPIVFHIIHQGGVGNIQDSEVFAGLENLNSAFRNEGPYDDQVGENMEVQFCIASRTPNDESTNGINRVQSPLTNFNMNSQDLALKNLIRWDPTSYINVWIVDEICSSNGCGVAGYAYFPSSHGGHEDGIVIEKDFIGSSSDQTSVLVHEMGHYLGLYHTFQDGCGNNDCLKDGDKVCDTPPDATTARIPCSITSNSCNSDVNSSDPNNPFVTDQNDMINNYMDYSNLECYNAFTPGQKIRIHSSIEFERSSLLNSKACLDPCLNPIELEIQVAAQIVNVGESVSFSSNSSGAVSFEWMINDNVISNSSSANYTFNEEGSYTVVLTANNSDPNCIETTTIEIEVVCPVVAAFITVGNNFKPGDEIFFSNTSQNASSYIWMLDGIPISMSFNFSTTLFIEGTYDLQLIASNGLCSDTSSLKIITISQTGIAGTGLPIWPVTSSNSGVIETVDWQNNEPVINILSESGDNPTGQTGVAIDACGDLAFYAIHIGSSIPNELFLFLPDGTELLSKNTSNGPGLNGVRGLNEIQVVRVPTYSNEWFIIYSKWSSDVGAPLNNAGYNPAPILYSRVRLNDKEELVVLQRDVELTAGGALYKYTDGKAVSRTAYGDRDKHFFYACRRSNGSNQVSVDRFLITSDGINWEKNTGSVNVPWWNLSIAGSPIELSPTEDRIAVACRNQDKGRPDVLIFNSDTFSSNDYIEISAGELILVSDGTSNDLSSVLPYMGRVKDIAYDNNLPLKFLRNYERKLSRMEFSPNGRFLYLNTGGFNQGGRTNLTYLSQIDLESNPMQVRMQIQTTPNNIYDPITGIGCSTNDASCFDSYPAITNIQSSYDGKLYFAKRYDNIFYVIPTPNDILPQNLVPSYIDLETDEILNIEMNGRTSVMPDQIDGHNYTDDRFSKIWFNATALDCNNECLDPYPIHLYLGNNLIESFTGLDCPDEFEFCGDTSKVYSLYSPTVNIRYDSAIVYGQIHYPGSLEYFDFSDLEGCKEICDNQIDDDNDGLVDCEDPDLQDSCCCLTLLELDLGPDIETCANGVFTLNAGEGFSSYKWSDLTTNSTTTAYEPGNYWVEVTDICGNSQMDTIEIIWSPVTQIDLGEDISICNGESLEIELSGFDTYEWTPTEGLDCNNCDKVIITANFPTSYIVVAGKNGCYSVDTLHVSIGEDSYQSIDTTLCENDVLLVGNVELEIGDSQSFVFKNTSGCDSIVDVTVNSVGLPNQTTHIDTLICSNQSINLFGKQYFANSYDTLRYQSILGCDSTIFINVGGIPEPSTKDSLWICYGESAEIFGNQETVSGDYTQVFVSQYNCDSTHTISLTVQEEIVPTFDTKPRCHNEINGSIDLTVSGGSAPYSYSWSNGETVSSSINGLHQGEYFVTVSDQLGCTMIASAYVETQPNIDLQIETMDLICYGDLTGIIDLSNNPTGLLYGLNTETYSDQLLYDSLGPGTYVISAIDEYGCTYSSSIEIDELEELTLSLPNDTMINFGEEILIIPSINSNGTITYFWPNSEGLDCDDCMDPIARPFYDIMYTLEIVDEFGCIAIDEMLIQVDRKNQVSIPNVFSPNGDMVNDYFLPVVGPGVKSILKMDIYDRWGGLMYEKSNFDPHALDKGWDGTSGGKPVNDGVFVYLITVEYIDGLVESFSGDLTVLK